MATGRYAADTSVSSENSRAEIERTLTRYGATQFMYGWGEHEGAEVAVVGFMAQGRQVRFHLQMPDRRAREFTHTPTRAAKRSDGAAHEAWEQGCRQRWRALALTIKALLEAIEVGILSFEQAFLANIMLPDGQTVGDAVQANIQEAYENHVLPALLPAYRPQPMIEA